MPTYCKATHEDDDLLAEVMTLYHADLADAGVRVGLLYAHAKRDDRTGEPRGPALKLHGYPCAALVRINSQRDRVQGKPDATIELDADAWEERPREEKVAILDHELEHLLLVRDDAGGVALDDANRPKLKMREHDLVIGGFVSVCERHKMAALEAQAYRDVHNTFTQRLFPWS